MKTTTLEYCELFDKIFTNCTSNEGNAQSITSCNCTSEQASNIDLQLNTALTFDQYGISDMSDESNNPERKNRAKKFVLKPHLYLIHLKIVFTKIEQQLYPNSEHHS